MGNVEDYAVLGAIFIFFIFFIFISIIFYIVNSIFLSKIFKKAGVPEYIAWIPAWNNWELFELGGQKGYLSLLAYVGISLSGAGSASTSIPAISIVVSLISIAASIASLVFFIRAMINIGSNLGKSTGFVVLGVFFYTVWLGILAFDKSTWHGANHNQAQTVNAMPAQNIQSVYANNPNNQQFTQQPTYMPPNIPSQAPVSQPQNSNPNPENQPPQPPTAI